MKKFGIHRIRSVYAYIIKSAENILVFALCRLYNKEMFVFLINLFKQIVYEIGLTCAC